MKRSSALLLLLTLSACAVGPDYKRPPLNLPTQWQSATDFHPAVPGDAQFKGNWWEMFADPQLNKLVQQALKQNQTLQGAVEHVQQARLQRQIVSSAQLPQVALQASDARFKSAINRPVAAYGQVNTSTLQNNPQLGLVVSYEADFFGRARRMTESATAAEVGAGFDFENTRLMLLAELATTYFRLRALDEEIELVQQGVLYQEKNLTLIRDRHELDYASGLDLAQQQALFDASKTQLTLLQNQRALLKNALATLTGTAAPEFNLAAQSALQPVPLLGVGLPADVLQRRPDISAAERAMAAANARIGVAQAGYYPTLMLNASGGWDSTQMANLFSAPSLLWALGASLTQTVFDAGKTSANAHLAESIYVQTVAGYRQTVLVALQEVQNGIDSQKQLTEALVEATAAEKSAQQVLELANVRYSGGLDSYLNVIVAQEAMLNNQRLRAQIHGQQLQNAVYLVKALGGGWQGL